VCGIEGIGFTCHAVVGTADVEDEGGVQLGGFVGVGLCPVVASVSFMLADADRAASAVMTVWGCNLRLRTRSDLNV